MMDVGRICVKIAGRDAGKKCVIVETLKDNYVIIDGQTRRKKCNVIHLEPLDQKLGIASNADHAAVVAAFKKLGVEIVESKKRQPAGPRPKKQKIVHNKEKKEAKKAKAKEEKPAKKEVKAAKVASKEETVPNEVLKKAPAAKKHAVKKEA